LSWRSLRSNVDATILIPLVVGLGTLAYVSYLGAARRSGSQFVSIVSHTWFIILLLTLPYLLARLVVWYDLLHQLGITPTRRQLVVAFAGGEMTKSLPAGVYVQNYLLERMRHLNLRATIRSTTATTATLGLESLLALAVVLAIGIPGLPWLRAVLLGIVAAWIVVLVLLWALLNYRLEHMSPRLAPWRRTLIRATEHFFAAGEELLQLRTLRDLVPTAVYMLLFAVQLDVIMVAASVHLRFLDVVSIYSVMVLAVILVPIPTEIGITELTGVGVLLAEGVPRSTAALIVLSLRLLGTGATVLVALAALIIAARRLAQQPAGETAPSS
jgi:uncharacterized membrane protein YbhN (UPF0104 family)